MRLRNTLLLAVFLIILGAYVYFFELQKASTGKSERLLDFKEEEAQSLVLTYPDQEIRLQRNPHGRWRLVHPLEAAADESAVGAILAALDTSDVKRTVEEQPSEADLRSYGLDQPEVKVLLSLRDGIALPPVFIGGRTPVGGSVYVRRGGVASVLLTDASLKSSLQKDLTALRDKEILSARPDQIARLTIRTPKESLVLVKGEKEEWRPEAPTKAKTKQKAVSDYLTFLGQLRAKGFADDEAKSLKKYGLDAPAVKISTADKEEKELESLLLGGKAGPDYYAARGGSSTVYTIDEFSYSQLNKRASDFLEEEKKEQRSGSAPQRGRQ